MAWSVTQTCIPRHRLSMFLAVLCVSAPLIAPGARAAPPTQQAGVSSAVKGQVDRASTVSDTGPRQNLEPGSKVYMQDRVSSEERSLAQLLLLDESTFKLGPNSSVVIDEFIYDPEQGTGEMVVEAASGVMRFISGAIGRSDPDNVEINTPLGSLGVRGTMVTVSIRRAADGQPEEALYVLNGPGADNNALARRGAIQVSAQGETVTVQRAGWGTFVRPGQPPTRPQPIPSETVAALDRELAAAPSSGTGFDAPGVTDTIRRAGADRISGQTTARTRGRGDTAAEVDDVDAATREVASANELEDFQVPGAPPTGDLTEFGNLQTLSGLRGVNAGTASASQSAVPIYRVSDIESLQPLESGNVGGEILGDLTGLNLQDIPQKGQYDVSFSVDFSAKTYQLSFDNISLPGFELTGSVSRGETVIPEPTQGSDIPAIFAATDSGGACLDAQCNGIVAALKNDQKALSGIISLFLEGTGEEDQLVGIGITGAD